MTEVEQNSTENVNEIDQNIGHNLRQYRKLSRMSLEELGRSIGVTYQQVQKYEKGTNRISASALYLICKTLGIKYEDMLPPLTEERKETEGISVDSNLKIVNKIQKLLKEIR